MKQLLPYPIAIYQFNFALLKTVSMSFSLTETNLLEQSTDYRQLPNCPNTDIYLHACSKLNALMLTLDVRLNPWFYCPTYMYNRADVNRLLYDLLPTSDEWGIIMLW